MDRFPLPPPVLVDDDEPPPPPPPPPEEDDEIADLPTIIPTRKPMPFQKQSVKPIRPIKHKNSSKMNRTNSKRKWKKRWFYLEKSTFYIYEDDEDDEPLYTTDVKNAAVYSFPGRIHFCFTAKNETSTHYIEAENSRVREQWLNSLHKHGANIMQPSNCNPLSGSGRLRKDLLKIWHVGKNTNEGPCHEGLEELVKLVEEDIEKRDIVKDVPLINREIRSLEKQISGAKLEEQLAKENASSAIAQTEEARKIKQHLETTIGQTHEEHKGSKIKGTALKTYREMDKLKKEREISRLQELDTKQKKITVELEREWKQFKRRVSELESQQNLVLQQTGKSIKKISSVPIDINIPQRTERSFSALFMGADIGPASNAQNEFDQIVQRNSFNQDSIREISQLISVRKKQSEDLVELQSTQEEMNEHMLLLQKQKVELERAVSKPPELNNDDTLSTGIEEWEEPPNIKYDTSDPICVELGEKLDALHKDYQKLEKFTEQITGELQNDIDELNRSCEEMEASRDEMESAAEQIIGDLEEEKEGMMLQLEQNDFSSPLKTRSRTTHSRTATIAMSSQELQKLREENIRLKSCLQLGGDDVHDAQEDIRQEKERYMKILKDLKGLTKEKYVHLEDMLKQREEMDVLEESVTKKNQRIAELEQDNAALESKLVHLSDRST